MALSAGVAAAVPVRPRAAGGLEYLLVRTRDGMRWTFPKGRREPGESAADAALREAEEEAGITGTIGAPLGCYRYASARGTDLVAAFVLVVEREDLPGEPGRAPAWFGFEAARSLLSLGRDPGYGEQMERVLTAAQRAVSGA